MVGQLNLLYDDNKLQIGHERTPSQFASRESYTPWPMRDVKDNAIYRKRRPGNFQL
jgi:hypothetical protein